MAVIMGIFIPLAETVRRFHQLTDISQFLFWFDDYILGGILLWAAWKLKTDHSRGILYMIAAWGIGAGALFLSFLGQFDYIFTGQNDVGGIFSVWVVLFAKGFILAYMIIGLWLSIKAADGL